jgi:hypothetical protein
MSRIMIVILIYHRDKPVEGIMSLVLKPIIQRFGMRTWAPVNRPYSFELFSIGSRCQKFRLFREELSYVRGRAVAQALSCWLPTAADRVLTTVRSCGIHDRRSVRGGGRFSGTCIETKRNSVAWVGERSILTELPLLVEQLVPTFEDRGCHVVSVTDPYGRILGFLDRSRYFFFQVAPQLYSRGWVDPVPDPLQKIW